MKIRRYILRLAAWAAGISLCLTPAAAGARQSAQTVSAVAGSVPAVAAPFPASSAADPAAQYRKAASVLAQLGLTREQTGVLWARYGAGLWDRLATGELFMEELAYLSLPHYRQQLQGRYLAYAQADPARTPGQVVTDVNTGLDQPFYTGVAPVADPASLTALVNKHHSLPADYVPQLEELGWTYGVGSLHPEAARQFRAMADAAWAEGISLRSVSSYRSYSTQNYLYNGYLAVNSQAVVDTFSARPGHSEHQTGLAVDINVADTRARFENTPAYAWLQAHCADYGFILRYPQGKQHITGYLFEPWHYRYVGVETARACMSQGLTYEEYAAALPAEELELVPALAYEGKLLDLDGGALVLEGAPYLSAARLAQALGWSAGPGEGRDTLALSGGGSVLALRPGSLVRKNGAAVWLSSPALELEGELYLPLKDLCALMGLSLRKTGLGLEVSGGV